MGVLNIIISCDEVSCRGWVIGIFMLTSMFPPYTHFLLKVPCYWKTCLNKEKNSRAVCKKNLERHINVEVHVCQVYLSISTAVCRMLSSSAWLTCMLVTSPEPTASAVCQPARWLERQVVLLLLSYHRCVAVGAQSACVSSSRFPFCY